MGCRDFGNEGDNSLAVQMGREQASGATNHVHAATASRHGHPGVCCCLTQGCRATDCNRNATLTAAAERMSNMELTGEQTDALLIALSREAFALPFAAKSWDYATPQELRAADDEAWQENRTALRTALRAAGLS